ncbi:hypothetical protein OF83DRAFT_1089991 [Amylostereum chailletii]|nr:hypothetical protein OF83DRAFT_1089991 [Amylostereum chailletii]
MMLSGLLRWRTTGTYSEIWRMLYRHGLVWLLLAIITEVPVLLLLGLDLNQPMDLVFTTPASKISIGNSTGTDRL